MSVRRSRENGERRGQHFLASAKLAASLAGAAGVGPGDLAVDVGAGTGVLTRALRARGSHVVAIERDRALAARLRASFERDPGVEIAEADAREWEWPRREFHVVANLPFFAAADVLRSLLDDPAVPLLQAHLILQWEAAVKLASVSPSTLRSVYWSAWRELVVVRRLGPSAFAPPPSVAAGVLRIVPRAQPLVPAGEHRLYRAFLERCWHDVPIRRALRGELGARGLKQLAREQGFATDARPRDLDVHQWAALYRTSRV